MKFEELALEWFENKKKFLKESTEAYYLFDLQNYIIPALGNIEIEQLNEEIIQKNVYLWQTQNGIHYTAIKKSTISNLVTLIKQILKYGVKKNLIHPFELEIFYIPEMPTNKDKTFTKEEQDNLIAAVISDLSFKSFGILLSLSTGMRIGELCALHWSDVDSIRNIITIHNTLQRVYNKNLQPSTRIIIGKPKTIKSIRNIPLSEKVQNAISCLPDINKDGYVLTNTTSFI